MDGQQPVPQPADDGAPQIEELVSLVSRARDSAAAIDSVAAEVEAKRASAASALEELQGIARDSQAKSAEATSALESARTRISELEAEVASIRASLAQSGSDGASHAQTKLSELDAVLTTARTRTEETATELSTRGQAGLALIEGALQQANARRDEASAAANSATEERARAAQLLNEIQVARAEVEANNQVTTQAAAAKQTFDNDAAAMLATYQASLSDAEEKKHAFQESYAAAKADVDQLTAQAETMLFGATNAGIASTFKEEVTTLDRRIRDAERMFLFGLFAIGVSLIPLIMYMLRVSEGHELTLPSVLARTAILIPAIWLTRHFARRIHANFELRQQYVHKYSMGAIVEPFRRQAGEHAPNVVAGVADELMKNPASVLRRHQKMGDGPVDDLTDAVKPITKLLPGPDRSS